MPIHGGRVKPTAFVLKAVRTDSRMESRASATSADSFGRSRLTEPNDTVRCRVLSERQRTVASSLPSLFARCSTLNPIRVVNQPQPQEMHEPVLAQDLAQSVVTDTSGIYLDATFGRGGHAKAILSLLSEGGKLVGLDRDPDASEAARELERHDPRFKFVRSRFSEIHKVLDSLDIHVVSGVCFDVGVSTPQLKNAERGFAFDLDGPLDMRMEIGSGSPASDWLNSASIADLSQVLKAYGDVRAARSIARQIVSRRPLETTFDLVDAIRSASRSSTTSAKVLAQVFQAIRIFVNDELNELQAGLKQAFEVLAGEGRLAVISFHSIEHRLARDMIQSWVRPAAPRGLPIRNEDPHARIVLKNVRPGYSERQSNPASRSATMQVIERLR